MTHHTLPKSPHFRVWEVAAYLGCGQSTVWRWVHTIPGFPQPKKKGPNFTVWIREEVEAYALGKKHQSA